MCNARTPYDEFAYECGPLEWTAPERLALTSRIHDGPTSPQEQHRVLELGCGNAANLLPLAYYRRSCHFVGIDNAATQIEVAQHRRDSLGARNLELHRADFLDTASTIQGRFDYVICHGVFSWIPDETRDALLRICNQTVSPGGLLYLSYNTKPGWNVRGIAREYLLTHTRDIDGLRKRTATAQNLAGRLSSILRASDHPYSQLLANEFDFVHQSAASYVAHEFLADINRAYWRSEFLALLQQYGFSYVADADYNYPSGQIPAETVDKIAEERLVPGDLDDTVDLLCYRQLHCPILTTTGAPRTAMTTAEFGALWIASSLDPITTDGQVTNDFKHTSGYEVDAKEQTMSTALTRLRPLWPRGLRVAEVFDDVEHVMEDLKLLQRNGLIELRCIEPGDFDVDPVPLNRLEAQTGNYVTTPYHTRETPPATPKTSGGSPTQAHSTNPD